jgi:hypothetical protein
VGQHWVFFDYTDVTASAPRYSLYERAVILARAVMQLLEASARAERGPDPAAPPVTISPALQRVVAELAQEVAQAKHSAVANILRCRQIWLRPPRPRRSSCPIGRVAQAARRPLLRILPAPAGAPEAVPGRTRSRPCGRPEAVPWARPKLSPWARPKPPRCPPPVCLRSAPC